MPLKNTPMRSSPLFAATFLATLAGARSAAGQQPHLYLIPDFPHPAAIQGGMSVKAVTDTGVVVGAASDVNVTWYGDSHEDTSLLAFRYSIDTQETVSLGKFTGAFNFSSATASTPDGSQIFGVSSLQVNSIGLSNNRGFKWTAQAGQTQLGIIPGDDQARVFAHISAATPDGLLLVGGSGTSTSYRWTGWGAGGASVFQFPDPVHTVFGELEAVSDDGQTAFGYGNQTGLALIWRGGAPALTSLVLPGGTHSQGTAMSGDGATFVGVSDAVYQGTHYQHVFRYRADTGIQDLNQSYNPASYHSAMGLSRDGFTVLGDNGTAWIWRQGRGVVTLSSYFTQELGLSLSSLVNPYATAISPSGRFIAGQASDPLDQDSQIGWVVDTRGGPICPCDWNYSGSLNSQDYFDFLNDFFVGNADFNHDNVTNSQDFFDFLNCFFAGCP